MAKNKVEETEPIVATDQTITIPAGNTEAAFEQVKQEQDKAVEELAEKIEGVSDTAAKEEAKAQVFVEQSAYSLGDLATSTYISTDVTLPSHPNDVQFNVTDPKNTSLKKGITVVSKEVAEQFEEKGFGKIVK